MMNKPLCELTHLEALARVVQLETRLAELEAEAADDDDLRTRLSALLTGTAAGLKGEPEPDSLHDWSDLPLVAARLAGQLHAIKEHASGFACWWALTGAQEELFGSPIPDDSVILHFSGGGLSTMVTAREIRRMLDAICGTSTTPVPPKVCPACGKPTPPGSIHTCTPKCP